MKKLLEKLQVICFPIATLSLIVSHLYNNEIFFLDSMWKGFFTFAFGLGALRDLYYINLGDQFQKRKRYVGIIFQGIFSLMYLLFFFENFVQDKIIYGSIFLPFVAIAFISLLIYLAMGFIQLKRKNIKK